MPHTPDVVRPQINRDEYADWQRTAAFLGYSNSSRGLWKLVRILFQFAKENPSFFRKR